MIRTPPPSGDPGEPPGPSEESARLPEIVVVLMLAASLVEAGRETPLPSRLPPNCSAFDGPWPPRASAVFPVIVDP